MLRSMRSSRLLLLRTMLLPAMQPLPPTCSSKPRQLWQCSRRQVPTPLQPARQQPQQLQRNSCTKRQWRRRQCPRRRRSQRLPRPRRRWPHPLPRACCCLQEAPRRRCRRVWGQLPPFRPRRLLLQPKLRGWAASRSLCRSAFQLPTLLCTGPTASAAAALARPLPAVAAAAAAAGAWARAGAHTTLLSKACLPGQVPLPTLAL